jgi:hypothetical protein
LVPKLFGRLELLQAFTRRVRQRLQRGDGWSGGCGQPAESERQDRGTE